MNEIHHISPIAEGMLRLKNIPEYRTNIHWLIEEHRRNRGNENDPITILLNEYSTSIQLFNDLAHLQRGDLKLIEIANKIAANKHIKRSSAAKDGTLTFLRKMTPRRMNKMEEVVQSASDVHSPFFQEALTDLATRLREGSELKKEGIARNDETPDPRVAHAIYGHTKDGISETAKDKIAFWHYLSRLFTAAFKNDPNKSIQAMAATKDAIFGPLEELINLRYAQGRLNQSTFDAWTNGVVDGGMGWNKQEMQDIYKSIVISQ